MTAVETADLIERLKETHGDTWPRQTGYGDLVNPDGPEAVAAIERLQERVVEAHAAILRARTVADDMGEGWSEEARQANAERDAKAERECMARSNSYDRIINEMQPVLGEALRAKRAASLLTKEPGE